MHKPDSVLENETHNILWDFETQRDHLIPPRKTDVVIINRKKKNLPYVYWTFPSHRVKIKDSEKRDKYLDLAWELRKLWNVRVMVIPNVIGMLGIVPKVLDELIPFKLPYGWDQSWYWEEFWRPEKTWCNSDFSERLSANFWWERLMKRTIIIVVFIEYSNYCDQMFL